METTGRHKMNLSKSKFVAGIQCLKRLYLQIHEPELASEPDESAVVVMSQGQEVGLMAQGLFPGGLAVEFDHGELDKALVRTAELVADSNVPAIFEATFKYDNVLVRVDILERLARNKWRLLEVKSSTDIKEHYLYDVAIQRHIVRGCGLKVTPCIVHLNRQYVYDGHKYKLERLFTVRDLTKEVDGLDQDLPKLLREEQKILAQSAPPDIEPGQQCKTPYTCEFFDHCNEPLPPEHVSFLPRIRGSKLAKLIELGFDPIRKIPSDFPLSAPQRRACDCVQAGTIWFGEGLKEEINRLTFPLYFMDFETLFPAIPRHPGMRPYDQIPFQWSVHVQCEPGGNLEHHEFLSEDESDPRRAFVKSLCKVLGKKGQIVVYHSFEEQRLADIAGWLPEFADKIANVQGRLWDLLKLMRSHVYHPQFMGSYSLKSVLPALVPEMSYDGMEVADGGQAGLAWEKMVRGNVGQEEKQKLRGALLAYCKQDTLAMTQLLRVLESKAPPAKRGR